MSLTSSSVIMRQLRCIRGLMRGMHMSTSVSISPLSSTATMNTFMVHGDEKTVSREYNNECEQNHHFSHGIAMVKPMAMHHSVEPYVSEQQMWANQNIIPQGTKSAQRFFSASSSSSSSSSSADDDTHSVSRVAMYTSLYVYINRDYYYTNSIY